VAANVVPGTTVEDHTPDIKKKFWEKTHVRNPSVEEERRDSGDKEPQTEHEEIQ